MNIEEHIESIFEKKYEGCDTAVIESNPRAYGLEWVRVGFYAGMEVGQKMKGEVNEQVFNRGYAQGLAYAVWVAGVSSKDSPIIDALKAARDSAWQKAVL